MSEYKYHIIVEYNAEGYTAICPDVDFCIAQGQTFDEVYKNIFDVVKLYLYDIIESGEKIPRPSSLSHTFQLFICVEI